MANVTYNFLFKDARVVNGKVEVLGEFQNGALDGSDAWIWFENLQQMIDKYCIRSGDTIEQAVDRFKREIEERR